MRRGPIPSETAALYFARTQLELAQMARHRELSSIVAALDSTLIARRCEQGAFRVPSPSLNRNRFAILERASL